MKASIVSWKQWLHPIRGLPFNKVLVAPPHHRHPILPKSCNTFIISVICFRIFIYKYGKNSPYLDSDLFPRADFCWNQWNQTGRKNGKNEGVKDLLEARGNYRKECVVKVNCQAGEGKSWWRIRTHWFNLNCMGIFLIK